MTDQDPDGAPAPATTPDPLDHDKDGRKGGARAPQSQWVVSRRDGLHHLPPAEALAAVRAGARPATARDLAVAGVDADPVGDPPADPA